MNIKIQPAFAAAKVDKPVTALKLIPAEQLFKQSIRRRLIPVKMRGIVEGVLVAFCLHIQ